MTRRSTLLGGSSNSFDQSIATTGAASAGRRAIHPRLERWRSRSANAVSCPAVAKAAARWVAIVVLPQPPFTLAISTENIPRVLNPPARMAKPCGLIFTTSTDLAKRDRARGKEIGDERDT